MGDIGKFPPVTRTSLQNENKEGLTWSEITSFLIVNFHHRSSNLRFLQHLFCPALHSHRY